MVKYPIGILTFENIRDEGFLYLYMTSVVHKQVCNSGYLTIKSYDAQFNDYVLGNPNVEVERSFTKFLFYRRMFQVATFATSCSRNA
jgi:hypothetical protein